MIDMLKVENAEMNAYGAGTQWEEAALYRRCSYHERCSLRSALTCPESCVSRKTRHQMLILRPSPVFVKSKSGWNNFCDLMPRDRGRNRMTFSICHVNYTRTRACGNT